MFVSVEAATENIDDCNNTLMVATISSNAEIQALPRVSGLYHPDSAETGEEAL